MRRRVVQLKLYECKAARMTAFVKFIYFHCGALDLLPAT